MEAASPPYRNLLVERDRTTEVNFAATSPFLPDVCSCRDPGHRDTHPHEYVSVYFSTRWNKLFMIELSSHLLFLFIVFVVQLNSVF